MALTPEEIQRYKRHLVLHDIGGQGQAKLKAARVLDRDAAQHERAPLDEPVRIDRGAHAEVSQSAPPGGRAP